MSLVKIITSKPTPVIKVIAQGPQGIPGPAGVAGAAGSTNLFIQADAPVSTEPYLWVQLIDSETMTLWVEDNL